MSHDPSQCEARRRPRMGLSSSTKDTSTSASRGMENEKAACKPHRMRMAVLLRMSQGQGAQPQIQPSEPDRQRGAVFRRTRAMGRVIGCVRRDADFQPHRTHSSQPRQHRDSPRDVGNHITHTSCGCPRPNATHNASAPWASLTQRARHPKQRRGTAIPY